LLIHSISMVRNEADIVGLNIRYHLSLGIDRMIIVDNGSTDGTDRILKELSDRDPRIRWSRDDGPFLPSRVMTGLAREALREGADWIVPIDADEFWYAPKGNFRKVLEEAKASVLVAQVVNFVQRREQDESSPDALLHMTRRAPSPIGPPGHGQGLVESRRIGFVEKMYPPKCLSRPTEDIEIETGHHKVYGVDGPRVETGEVLCLHAPIRSRAALKERVESASRAAAAGRKPGQGRNRRRLAKLDGENEVEQEWQANSYQDDNLDVYGERHPVVFDPRLRGAVAPFVAQPLWRRLYRRLWRTNGGKGT
jgi:Glycosyl transferase family 2